VRSTPCTRRRGTQVSWFGLQTKVNCFSQFGLKTGGYRFSSLGLKTGSYGLEILATKSPRWFLGLSFKTKRATVFWLRHKTDRSMKMAWDTRRNPATCFGWKQVGLGFLSLTSRLVEGRYGWCTWHHNEGCVELKLKTGGSMR
jgi:hypothetical protein